MSMPYTPPEFNKSAFNCPFCNAYAQMVWAQLLKGGTREYALVHAARCSHCSEESFWLQDQRPAIAESISGRMIHPEILTAPSAHPEMPEAVRLDYEEGRRISVASPRGSAALLRLAIQKLCKFLGQPGKKLNDDIGALVEAGLPLEIQQALDVVRVVGNNAVHPGELSEEDVQGISNTLFTLLNSIVEDRIARPKKLRAIFDLLPQGAREAIEKRDS